MGLQVAAPTATSFLIEALFASKADAKIAPAPATPVSSPKEDEVAKKGFPMIATLGLTASVAFFAVPAVAGFVFRGFFIPAANVVEIQLDGKKTSVSAPAGTTVELKDGTKVIFR